MSRVAAMRPMLPACLVLSRPPAPQALVYDGRRRHNMCLLPHAPHAPRLLGAPGSGINLFLFATPPPRVVAAPGRTATGCKWFKGFKSAASCAPPRKPHVAARCRPRPPVRRKAREEPTIRNAGTQERTMTTPRCAGREFLPSCLPHSSSSRSRAKDAATSSDAASARWPGRNA